MWLLPDKAKVKADETPITIASGTRTYGHESGDVAQMTVVAP